MRGRAGRCVLRFADGAGGDAGLGSMAFSQAGDGARLRSDGAGRHCVADQIFGGDRGGVLRRSVVGGALAGGRRLGGGGSAGGPSGGLRFGANCAGGCVVLACGAASRLHLCQFPVKYGAKPAADDGTVDQLRRDGRDFCAAGHHDRAGAAPAVAYHRLSHRLDGGRVAQRGGDWPCWFLTLYRRRAAARDHRRRPGLWRGQTRAALGGWSAGAAVRGQPVGSMAGRLSEGRCARSHNAGRRRQPATWLYLCL